MSLQRDVALFAALARAAERENPGQHIVTFIFLSLQSKLLILRIPIWNTFASVLTFAAQAFRLH